MKMSKKVKNFVATIIICSALITGRPAHAYLWPTVDLTQISTFVSSISQSIGQVTTAIAQIENYTATIHAIGDQVSAYAKYVTEIKNAIDKIIAMVNEIMASLSYGIHTMDSILKDLEAQVFDTEYQEEEIAEEITGAVEAAVEDEKYNEADVQKILEDGKAESQKLQQQTAEAIKKAKETMATIVSESNEGVDKLMDAIAKDAVLSEDKQKELKQEAEALKTEISNFQAHAEEVLNKMEKDCDARSKEVLEAYANYSRDIADYYANKITNEELQARGNAFKESIASLKTSVNGDALNELYAEADNIVASIDRLKENISNGVANNKDYSDEDEDSQKKTDRTINTDKKSSADRSVINKGTDDKKEQSENKSINNEIKIEKNANVEKKTLDKGINTNLSSKVINKDVGITKSVGTKSKTINNTVNLNKNTTQEKKVIDKNVGIIKPVDIKKNTINKDVGMTKSVGTKSKTINNTVNLNKNTIQEKKVIDKNVGIIKPVDTKSNTINNTVSLNKDVTQEKKVIDKNVNLNLNKSVTPEKKTTDKNVSPNKSADTPKNTINNNININNKINTNKVEKKIKKQSFFKSSGNVKYVFSFRSVKSHQYADASIAKKKKTGYYGIDQDFLLSKELVCDSNAKVDDLLDNPKDGMKWFKDCVIKAKAEKEYWCPEAKDEKAIAKCDPFKLSKGIYKDKYRDEGVYKHLYEDYSMANIVGLSKIKQYATTWQDLSNKDSTLSSLQDQFNKIDNTRNAYSLQSVIDLESPQLWSRLRRVDALERSKNVINYYRQIPTLFLDGRSGNEDYTDAQKEEPGTMTIDVGDGESEDKTIMSHMFLHLCGLTAEDISVSSEDKDNAKEAEEKIKKCIFKYVNLASRGGETEEDGEYVQGSSRNRDDVMKDWQANEKKALTDSMFDTFYLATVNNFRSSKDYAKLKEGEINIVSVQKGLKNAKEARDDYSAGAQTNYYSTQQLLTIIDADAQSLQTEIIQDLASMSYSFFDMKAEEGEKE